MTTFNLCDSNTNDTIRLATVDEVLASIEASAEGHITIDDRRVYVQIDVPSGVEVRRYLDGWQAVVSFDVEDTGDAHYESISKDACERATAFFEQLGLRPDFAAGDGGANYGSGWATGVLRPV